MAYGTALASFNVEEFGTERVARLTADEIADARGRPAAHDALRPRAGRRCAASALRHPARGRGTTGGHRAAVMASGARRADDVTDSAHGRACLTTHSTDASERSPRRGACRCLRGPLRDRGLSRGSTRPSTRQPMGAAGRRADGRRDRVDADHRRRRHGGGGRHRRGPRPSRPGAQPVDQPRRGAGQRHRRRRRRLRRRRPRRGLRQPRRRPDRRQRPRHPRRGHRRARAATTASASPASPGARASWPSRCSAPTRRATWPRSPRASATRSPTARA